MALVATHLSTPTDQCSVRMWISSISVTAKLNGENATGKQNKNNKKAKNRASTQSPQRYCWHLQGEKVAFQKGRPAPAQSPRRRVQPHNAGHPRGTFCPKYGPMSATCRVKDHSWGSSMSQLCSLRPSHGGAWGTRGRIARPSGEARDGHMSNPSLILYTRPATFKFTLRLCQRFRGTQEENNTRTPPGFV